MDTGSGSGSGGGRYEWVKEHGWWLSSTSPPDARPTHLLLDGGKVRVPDESAGAFLNAYAIAVVKRLQPCVVELRTAVFRMFLDLDVVEPSDAPLDFGAVMRILQARAAQFFAEDEPRAVVCETARKGVGGDGGGIKAGRHVVWTNVRVTSATALAYRAAVVEDLEAGLPGACVKPWRSVVDACVFQANGLRMPFSEKGRGNTATYGPAQVWTGAAEWKAVEAPSGVSAVREWVRTLSVRTFGLDDTPVREGVEVPTEASQDGLCGTSKSLTEYRAVLPALDAALPVQFAGQRFTGVIKTDSCFLLRSSAQYCMNLGRTHNSCGTYFVLSLKGIRQKCYCRCPTTEGRKFGLCKDFGSEMWPVPEEVLTAFFGAQSAVPPGFRPAVLPSSKASSAGDLAGLLSRSRPPLKAPPRKRRK